MCPKSGRQDRSKWLPGAEEPAQVAQGMAVGRTYEMLESDFRQNVTSDIACIRYVDFARSAFILPLLKIAEMVCPIST